MIRQFLLSVAAAVGVGDAVATQHGDVRPSVGNDRLPGMSTVTTATAVPFSTVAISPMTKLRRDQSVAPGAKTISLVAAKGEGESAQLLVRGRGTVSGATVSFTKLTGPGGATITPELRVADYVNVTQPTWVSYGVAGLYPDPLVPLKPFNLQAGQSQVIWLDVWVPRTAATGVYRGTVTVTDSGIGVAESLPVTLTVKAVTLPVTPYLDTMVQFLNSREVYSQAEYNALCELGLKYRFTSPPNVGWDQVFTKNSLGVWKANWTAFDADVQHFINLGATQFKIECLPWSTTAPTGATAAEWNAKLTLVSSHLRAKGWMDKFVFYIFDEPTEAQIAGINGLCDFIHARDSQFRILYTNGNNIWDVHADVFVPHIHLWANEGVAMAESKRQAGGEMWAYTCMGTQNIPYPDSWKMDWRGTGARALGWWLWMRQADGYLYWAIDGTDNSDPYNPDPIPGCNGDGFMFYRDTAGKPTVPSLRLSLLRDAIEDYDLFTMLKTKLNANPALMTRYGHLLDTTLAFPGEGRRLPPDQYEYLDAPTLYEQRHADILDVLSQP